MSLLTVAGAQARLLAGVAPLPPVLLPLDQSVGRFLAAPLVALRTQPDAPLSAMDGYAIRHADRPGPWRLIGESRAGLPFGGPVPAGAAVAISTGAIVPDGADAILVREEAAVEGAILHLSGNGPPPGGHIRPAGSDFIEGSLLCDAGRRVTARLIGLAATAGHGSLLTGGTPAVGLIATGDELVPPGIIGRHRTPSSNSAMIAAMLGPLGCRVTDFGIVADRRADLSDALSDAAGRCDIVVTSGGASVGEHDHLRGALADAGGQVGFWRIAMKPGKPLLSGRIGEARLVGLPGNPTSAFVTALLFLLPLVRALSGSAAPLPGIEQRSLATDLGPGGAREEYCRATLTDTGALLPVADQGSGLLGALASAEALIVRAIGAPPLSAGQQAPCILL